MGGPNFWTLLLRDGAIVHSACAAPQDVDGGKLRLIPTRSREGEGVTVYEPAARMMYALPALTDREQAALAAGSAEALARLRARCRQAEATPLRQVRGLWVPQWAEDPADRLAIALPSGRALAARSMLPMDLRHADDPAALLHAPPYELLLDNRPTNFFVCDLDRVAESPAGDGERRRLPVPRRAYCRWPVPSALRRRVVQPALSRAQTGGRARFDSTFSSNGPSRKTAGCS